MIRSAKGWLPLSLVAAVAVAILGLVAMGGVARAADGSVSITPTPATVAPAGTVDVTVTAGAPAAKLGAWQIDVAYDKTVVTVDPATGCDAADVGANVCNPAFTTNSVRVAGSSASGFSGTKDLATIHFKAVGAAGACSDLTITVGTFADPNGTAASPTVTKGQVCIQAPTPTPSPAPTASPTAAPTAAPTATPATLPSTGGAPSDGSSMTPWLLAALGLVVVSGGVWAVARTRR